MDFYNDVQNKFIDDTLDVRTLSPLVLAYVGDSVYEVYIRTMLISKSNKKVNDYHKQSITFVKAKAQAKFLETIYESLSDEEQNVIRRGKNAKSNTIPKNCTLHDYRQATAFEALIGYLYLKKENARLFEIFNLALKK